MATSPPGFEPATADGPVLSLMSKRLRALRKKYNRILQMEASLAQGKILNKEQEEVLRSKPGVVALIDEYEKLKSPLAAAVQEEVARTACHSLPNPNPVTHEAEESSSQSANDAIEDLLSLLYFGFLFDVKPQSEFTSMMLTRAHERGCCLTYDYVTDDATELLGGEDLDMISALGGMVTSRPLYSGISHSSALQGCLQHAKLWLQGAHEPIVSGSALTYAALREKLKRLWLQITFTTTPEMKAPLDVAAAVEKYNASCQLQVSESSEEQIPDTQIDAEDDNEGLQAADVSPDQSDSGYYLQKDDTDELNPTSGDAQTEQQIIEADGEEYNQIDHEQKDHPHVPRRSNQNPRGGRGGGGGRRGYSGIRGRNGRGGGGGGGGGYSNGRNQYYDTGYHPRNYYIGRGRGGRSGGSEFYSHQGSSNYGIHGSNFQLGANA
ncbi:hypothetical protein HPP92_019079 [Vanilla planifolia]|uniref:Glycine-rich protein n=2 Tax=Vanilla planifolia TaxID=51239 RepID=A0A835Q289_VANPL|nr:hypothetical protein HPP92_019079 [Vanilla planifolia]